MSNETTSSPRSNRIRTMRCPMNPLPPVTITVICCCSSKNLPISPTLKPHDFADVSLRVEVAGGHYQVVLLRPLEERLSGGSAVVFVGVDTSAPIRFVNLDGIVYQVSDYGGLFPLRAYERHLMSGRVAWGVECR